MAYFQGRTVSFRKCNPRTVQQSKQHALAIWTSNWHHPRNGKSQTWTVRLRQRIGKLMHTNAHTEGCFSDPLGKQQLDQQKFHKQKKQQEYMFLWTYYIVGCYVRFYLEGRYESAECQVMGNSKAHLVRAYACFSFLREQILWNEFSMWNTATQIRSSNKYIANLRSSNIGMFKWADFI